jgi:hypothetical protein
MFFCGNYTKKINLTGFAGEPITCNHLLNDKAAMLTNDQHYKSSNFKYYNSKFNFKISGSKDHKLKSKNSIKSLIKFLGYRHKTLSFVQGCIIATTFWSY